jgi:hypothetical protein
LLVDPSLPSKSPVGLAVSVDVLKKLYGGLMTRFVYATPYVGVTAAAEKFG